jgi:hypothetical protein
MKLVVTSDRDEDLPHSLLTAVIMDLDGKILHRQDRKVDIAADSNTPAGEVNYAPGKDLEGRVILVMLELRRSDGTRLSGHTYTFGVIGEDVDRPIPPGYMNELLEAPLTRLSMSAAPGESLAWFGKPATIYRLSVRNAGKVPALFVSLNTDNADHKAIYIEDNYFTLSPGEERNVRVFIPDAEKMNIQGNFRLSAGSWNSKTVFSSLE